MAHGRKTVDQEMADLFHNFGKTGEMGITALEEPWLYKIWDTNQKFLFLQNGLLQAAPLNSNSEDQVIAVVPNQILDQSKRPIFMGTKDGKHVLNVQSGDRPQLQLAGKDIMGLYKNKEEAKEFTFYNQTKGSEVTCSFESAASPGWFLSTASEPNKPLGLSQGGGSDITLFYIERKP
ncbi:PREDICTED: interleukin-36 receptor antagonist protein-like [Gekko japonicus]|uniref:Interleukin-1 n=1 Tax=Gekko japonicus TaxID=146911 RepID=A0ABM1KFQ8_GEKJA|nr:PREDICTED: interleukin-36 receptor antagonist protein-like [Gekko japonicus]XP_015272546.1 PREDICTED: interleukin-36 receptor antagonist protein-like [Gekko japonicus]